jgi:hypothetical protein
MERSPPSSPRSVVTNDLAERSPDSATSSHGGNALLFPWKLHDMLRTSKTDGKESIVSWLPHGNAFKVRDVPDFVSNILPLFFKQTKYKSFQRQLNLWGFERIQNGPEKNAYYHKQFLRDQPALCRHLTRQRAKKVSSVTTTLGATKENISTKTTTTTTTTTSFPKKSSSKVRQQIPAFTSSKINPIPRKVSEGSLKGFEELLGKQLDYSNNCYDPLDLAEFEGFTFHLLEQDRYEELNLKFRSTPEVRQEQNTTTLLKELEQGVFGIPKMSFDLLDLKPLDAQSC